MSSIHNHYVQVEKSKPMNEISCNSLKFSILASKPMIETILCFSNMICAVLKWQKTIIQEEKINGDSVSQKITSWTRIELARPKP